MSYDYGGETELIATLGDAKDNGKWAQNKEQVRAYTVIAATRGGLSGPILFKDVVTARLWMSRSGDGASPVYCSIWATKPDFHTGGHGKAGGYGYHKLSAALDDAITSAGIKLNMAISGVGDGAMDRALLAIGKAVAPGTDLHLIQL